jgi:hypothetical protein
MLCVPLLQREAGSHLSGSSSLPTPPHGSGYWPPHSDGPGGGGQRCGTLQERSTIGGMARSRATPALHGGKPHLLGISKRGDSYLRKLFVHGARATIRWIGLKNDRRSQWLRALIQRRGTNRAVVALANKNARIAWVLLTTDQVYMPEHTAA